MRSLPKVLAAGAALLLLVSCTLFSPSAPDPLAPFVAAQTATGLVANVAAGLRTTCILKDGGTITAITQGLSAADAAFAAGTADIAKGDMNQEAIAFNLAVAALTQVQAIVAGAQPNAAQVQKLSAHFAAEKAKKKFVFTIPVIISLVQAFLPAFEQGGAVYNVIQSLIGDLNGNPKPAYTAADVAAAQANLDSSVANWKRAAATPCS